MFSRVYTDTFPIPLTIKHGRKCLELVLMYLLFVWLVPTEKSIC